ncbi:MAG: MmgE/PrpD family protein [Phycisphaerales bacterium]|jgi:2-methylcitrate dehydratase|nr:MmgE/PrpD family protein [Phycisphaerales bacterium]
MGGHDTSKQNTDFISYQLAEWAANLTYEDLSDEAVQCAKLYLYDSFGCALGGSQQHDVEIFLDHARQMGGADTCTVFGSGFKTDPVMAAMLNALCIRAMDYNDIYWKADPAHPSDIIPAALSICEMNGLSGKDLILGTCIGHEIEMRLAEFGDPGVREYGWHHATITCIASPIVAGRMLGLPADQIQQAIGISASPSMCLGAVTAGKLTNMKNTVDPMATRSGVEAALLAARGYSGPEHVIDGKEGLVHCFEKFGGSFNLDMLTDSLPTCPKCHWKILDCGMKSFPIEALSHAPLTAMMKIVKANEVNSDDVAEIKVEVIARAADILGDPAKYRPTSKETADHSLPYSLAVGLVDGMVTPLQFKQERIDDPGLIPVMDKIKVVPNDEFEALFPKFQPSQVTITLADGTSYTERVDVPKGDPRDPMTEEEIAVKFDALGGGVVGADRCAELRDHIMSIETAPNLDRLFEMMTATACV